MGLICVGVQQAATFHPETLPGLSLESCKDDSFGQNLKKTSAEVLRHRCSFEEEAGPRSLEQASEPQVGVTYPGVRRFQNSHKLQGPRDTNDAGSGMTHRGSTVPGLTSPSRAASEETDEQTLLLCSAGLS